MEKTPVSQRFPRCAAAIVSAIIPLFMSIHAATAFDVDGYKTGMTKAEVLATSGKSYRISPLETDSNTLIATDMIDSKKYLSLNFCNDHLVSVQQGFPANLRQVSLLVANFSAKYGDPFSVKAGIRPDPTGEVYEIGYWWRANAEFASVYFSGSTYGDSLSTSRQAVNPCFKVPR